MRVLTITFLTSCIFLLGACSTQEAVDPSKQTLLSSTLLPEQIAENFYRELTAKEIEFISEAYQSMSYQETVKFIDARYNIDISEGVNPEIALQRKNIMHETNNIVFAEQGKPFSSVDIDKSAAIYAELLQSGKYNDLAGASDTQEEANRVASCVSWAYTKTIGYVLSSVSNEWPATYVGQRKFGTSTDCDYLFKSQKYNKYWKANRLVGKTFGTQNVLKHGGSSGNQAKEPGVSSTEAQLEFGAGKNRVNLYYFGWDAPKNFAKEIKVELVKR